MRAHFLELYKYNQWANDLFASALEQAPYQHEKIDIFFSHILAAELIWLSRITEINEDIPGVWGKLPLSEASARLTRSSQCWLDFIQDCGDFDRTVHYSNTKGESFSTPLQGIMTHVANHGTHHRAQIALLLREEGIQPPASDFIFYLRTRD